MKRSLELLNQILEMAEAQSELINKYYMAMHKASLTLGEKAVTFHLKQLRDLIQEEYATNNSRVTLGGKTFTVSLGSFCPKCQKKHAAITDSSLCPDCQTNLIPL